MTGYKLEKHQVEEIARMLINSVDDEKEIVVEAVNEYDRRLKNGKATDEQLLKMGEAYSEILEGQLFKEQLRKYMSTRR